MAKANLKLLDPRPDSVRRKTLGIFEAQLFAAAGGGFYQPPFLSVSDWAAENRILQGSESGRFIVSRCPYQQGIMDAFNDPEVREITWQAGERVGKSTVASNILGYVIDREPCNVLWVMPSREGMADFLADELRPMFRDSPVLRQKVSAGRTSTGKTNNIRRQSFLGGVCTFVGGGSSNPLSFRTVRIVILDEIDKLTNLKNEGDADSLATKRASTFGTDFKLLRFSKPTVADESRIERHFLRGSQSRYFISCPNCGEFQELSWSSLRFEDVTMRCTSCDQFSDQIGWLSQPGEWRESVANPVHKSFQCSALISPLLSWSVLIDDFKTAASALAAGDSSLMMVFENSRLGKTYSGRVDRIEAGDLYERREAFK